MSKRRISHQQSARIEKKQTHYRQQAETYPQGPTNQGLIITRYRHQALVESLQGDRILCSIRPEIDSLVAGDQVIWQTEGKGHGVVLSRLPRQSMLGRPNSKGQLKPIAANITQVMVVVAPKPEISWALLDSYLVMIEYLKLEACIVLNKVDLPSANLQQQLMDQYAPLGYSILWTQYDDHKSHQELITALNHHTNVFVGQSGVGKSSLVARILPTETLIQTTAISKHSELGQHTTSNSYLYHLPSGGKIIDSPGIRELGLWHMQPAEIAQGYREFRPYLSHCKFRNCDHWSAPGCAIKAAVNQHILSSHRYHNYVKILNQFAK